MTFQALRYEHILKRKFVGDEQIMLYMLHALNWADYVMEGTYINE
jgi:hypothetical protein